MPRPRREDYEGAWHHLMNRGAGRLDIFRDDADRLAFIECLATAARRSATEIHCYCLMSNHFHLLVRSTKGQLSDFLRMVTGRYAFRFNRRYQSDGPIFRGRCLTISVEDDAQLVLVSRYIHLNAVVAGLANEPSAWGWSSSAVHVGRLPKPDWLTVGVLQDMFSGVAPGFDYASYLADGIDQKTNTRYQELGW